jgi:hypothetical protein
MKDSIHDCEGPANLKTLLLFLFARTTFIKTFPRIKLFRVCESKLSRGREGYETDSGRPWPCNDNRFSVLFLIGHGLRAHAHPQHTDVSPLPRTCEPLATVQRRIHTK